MLSLCGLCFLCQRAGTRFWRQNWPAGCAPQKQGIVGPLFYLFMPDMYYIIDSAPEIYFCLVQSWKTGAFTLCMQIFWREQLAGG